MKPLFTKTVAVLAVTGLAMGWTACSSDEPEPEKTDENVSTTSQPTKDETFEPVDLDLTKQETDALAFSNTFSFNMFNAINRSLRTLSNKNIFISPLSIDLCLSMAANGSVGNTLDEFLNLLGQSSLDNENALNGKLMEALPYLDNATTVKFANGMWANKMFAIKDSYAASNSDIYKAEIANYDPITDDIVGIINQWASDNTNGMIKDILKEGDAGFDLYLANAVYFNGSWTTKFDGVTYKAFQSYDNSYKDIAYVYRTGEFDYTGTNTLDLVAIPFGNKSYEFDLIVPKNGNSVSDIAESLNSDTWNELINSLQPKTIDLEMPRLDISTSYNLIEYLKELGLKSAFSSSAEFDNITTCKPFKFDKILHKAAIKLDETGAEAAAVTVFAGFTASFDSTTQTLSVIANHPYLFVIREVSTNTIVFIGAINQM
jgi:serpin B